MMGASMENGDTGEGPGQGVESGRALVRELLLKPLSGLRRPPRHAASEYDALAERLAYMRADALRGLCEYCLRVAGGARPSPAPTCPSPAMIRAWAYAIQPPPAQESAFLTSVMRSALGAEAQDGQWHVQLFRHLRRFGPPLANSDYMKSKMREAASADVRHLDRIRERQAAGQHPEEDRRWLAAWHDDLRKAEELIAEGRAHRAAKMDQAREDQAQGDAA